MSHCNRYIKKWSNISSEDLGFLTSEICCQIPDITNDSFFTVGERYDFFDDYLAFLFIYAISQPETDKTNEDPYISLDQFDGNLTEWGINKKNIYDYQDITGSKFKILYLNSIDKNENKLFCIFRQGSNGKFDFYDICSIRESFFERQGDVIIAKIDDINKYEYNFHKCFHKFRFDPQKSEFDTLGDHSVNRIYERTSINETLFVDYFEKAKYLCKHHDWYSIPYLFYDNNNHRIMFQEWLPMFTEDGKVLFAIIGKKSRIGNRMKVRDKDNLYKIITVFNQEMIKNLKPQYETLNLNKWWEIWNNENIYINLQKE